MKKLKNLVFVCLALMAACTIQCNDAKAAKTGTYQLSDTSTNTNYDVTGDGVSDTVEFKKLNYNQNIDAYDGFKVVINNKTALHVKDVYFYDLETVFVQTKEHGYFLISVCHDNGDGPRKIYEYVDGKLKERVDFADTAGKAYYHYSAMVSSVKSNSFKVNLVGQTEMLAYTKMSFNFKVGQTGKLSLANKTVKVSYSNGRMNSEKSYKSKYLVAKKNIQVYRSATGTKKAFSIKKGTKLKITKVSVKGKTPRYYCITKSGKKGWVKSKIELFKDLMYAG